jgi:prophage antirepressor-like protein
MNGHNAQEPSSHSGMERQAIDISDFVHGATGTRIRRLTMPDGTHWCPAADVCRQLGHGTTRKALLDHVPQDHRDILETVTGRHSLSVPAGESGAETCS